MFFSAGQQYVELDPNVCEVMQLSPLGGDVAQLVERRTGTPLTQVRFPATARDFPPKVNFQCRLSHVCPYTPVCHRMH